MIQDQDGHRHRIGSQLIMLEISQPGAMVKFRTIAKMMFVMKQLTKRTINLPGAPIKRPI